MGGIAAIGEAQRVQGLSLAGVLVLPADSPEQVRASWALLPQDVVMVILTERASTALGEVPAGRLTVVMPR